MMYSSLLAALVALSASIPSVSGHGVTIINECDFPVYLRVGHKAQPHQSHGSIGAGNRRTLGWNGIESRSIFVQKGSAGPESPQRGIEFEYNVNDDNTVSWDVSEQHHQKSFVKDGFKAVPSHHNSQCNTVYCRPNKVKDGQGCRHVYYYSAPGHPPAANRTQTCPLDTDVNFHLCASR